MSDLSLRFRPGLRLGPQIVILVLTLGLVGSMAVRPLGQLFRQRALMVEMTDELGDLKGSNAALEARIERLQDPDYLEQRAREQTGLVRPGETTYVVMPPTKKSDEARHRAGSARARPSPAPPRGFIERLLHFAGIG